MVENTLLFVCINQNNTVSLYQQKQKQHNIMTKLEKEFSKLNKEYMRIDNLMNLVCNTEDTFKYEMQLEEIQNKMSEISAKMENENN